MERKEMNKKFFKKNYVFGWEEISEKNNIKLWYL